MIAARIAGTFAPPAWRLPAAALAGAVAAQGFAPGVLLAPAVIGVGALLLLLGLTTTRRSAFATGWWFGWGHFIAGLTWIATAFSYQSAMPPWMGWAAVVGLSAFLALYAGLAALAAAFARTVPARALVLAGAWTAAEIARGVVFTGFAWNPLGAAWMQLPGTAQLAAVVGANGLSALVVLAGGGLAALVAGGGARWRWPLVWVLPALVALNFVPREPLPAATGTRLMLVQANLDQARKLAPDGPAEGIRRHLALTVAALRSAPAPAAVIWPEAAVEDLVEEDPTLRVRLAGVLPARTLLLFGGLAVERDSAGWATFARNSLFAMDADGRLLARYDKAHLVPGGEYLPLRAIAEPLGLARLVPGGLDFLAGDGPRTLAVPGLPPLSPQICYEIIFPGAVTDRAARAAFILNVSNDAWFGPTGPPQHWEQARLRAIEEGLPVVRSTPTGITGVIDARGGVAAVLPAHRPGVLMAALPAALPRTPFALAGLAAPLALAAILIALGLFGGGRERKT